MIIIRPMNDTRHAATDAARHHINFRFAELLKDYIILKGDDCMLTRTSELDADPGISKYVNKYNITVYITIDMYADIDPNTSGYDFLCDTYNSLVATFNYEIFKFGRKPIRDLGYKVTNATRVSDYSDITVYLGYATNDAELNWWKDDTNLEAVAKRFIEGAYGPPVKTIEDTDPTGNNDPYFYKLDTWKETAPITGCSATIEETLYTGLPLRYLAIESDAELGEYTWETPSTYEKDTMCIFIGSLRSHGASPKCYIKIGNTEYTETISDTTFSIKVFEGTVGPGTPIKLGVKGKGRIDYSGIWVAPKGTLGALDDPRTDYSIFPPGYRPVNKVTSAYNTADSIHIALTDAHTLIERAQDIQASSSTTTAVKLDASTGIASDKDSNTDIGNILNSGVSIALKVANYAAALSAVMEIFGNKSEQKSAITDAVLQSIDFSALQSAVGAVRSFSDKAKIQASVNDMEGVTRAVDTAVTSDQHAAESATLALKDATSVKKNLEEGTKVPDAKSMSPMDLAKETVATAAKRETTVVTQMTSNKNDAWDSIVRWCKGNLITTIVTDAVDDESYQVSSFYGVNFESFKNAAGDVETALANKFNTWAAQQRKFQLDSIPPVVPEGETPPEPVTPVPPNPAWDVVKKEALDTLGNLVAKQQEYALIKMPESLLSNYATTIGREGENVTPITNANAIARFIENRQLTGTYRLPTGHKMQSSYQIGALINGTI